MKKILAGIIALTTVFCMFTSCGSTDDEKESGNKSSVETTADSEKETSEDEEDETKEEKKSDKKKDKESKADDKVYEDVVNEFIDAVNSKDIKKVFELQMPDGCIDVVKLMLLAQYEDSEEEVDIDKLVDEYIEGMLGDIPTLKFNKIVRIEDLNDDEIDSLKSACAAYIMLADYIKEQGGIDNIDLKKMEEEFENVDPSENIDSIKIDDAKYVTFEAIEEGEDEPSEEEFYIYRINGGEWHIDNSMLAYVRKSKKASANSAANSLIKAANTALVEMEEEDALHAADKMIVCSDESKNVNVSDDFDVAVFKKKLKSYFGDEEELDWFVVIKDGCAVYSVSVEKGKSQIGTYPVNSVLKSDMDTESDENIGSKSFDEVYDMCADILK